MYTYIMLVVVQRQGGFDENSSAATAVMDVDHGARII